MVDSIDTGVYLKFFKGREDYFAQQTEDGYSPVNKAFNEYYLEKHLMGNSTFGIYVLNRNSFCHFFCIDIDIPRELLNEVNYRDASVKYCFLKGKISIVVKTLLEKMGIPVDCKFNCPPFLTSCVCCYPMWIPPYVEWEGITLL